MNSKVSIFLTLVCIPFFCFSQTIWKKSYKGNLVGNSPEISAMVRHASGEITAAFGRRFLFDEWGV